MSSDEVPARLRDFSAAFQNLPDLDYPPKTTLEIIGEHTRESYWNRLLTYFLDPAEVHGFGVEVLAEFIETIEQRHEDVDLSTAALEEITVKSEAASDDGRVDVLLYLEEEWFVCVELKVTATEGNDQTVRYADADKFDALFVGDYPRQDRHYLYISNSNHLPPSADEFIQISWSTVVAAFRSVIADGRGRHPARSVAQLSDFCDSIESATDMTSEETEHAQDRRMELYLEYSDAIEDAEDAFEAVHERHTMQWQNRWIERHVPTSWHEHWNCDPRKYGQIYRDGWRVDRDGNSVDDATEATFRCEFQHLIWYPSYWKNGVVRFRTYTSRRADESYREQFKYLFNEEYSEEISQVLSGTDISNIGGIKTHTRKDYSYDPTDGAEGYYEALSKAFDEHAELVPILSEIHQLAIKQTQR